MIHSVVEQHGFFYDNDADSKNDDDDDDLRCVSILIMIRTIL